MKKFTILLLTLLVGLTACNLQEIDPEARGLKSKEIPVSSSGLEKNKGTDKVEHAVETNTIEAEDEKIDFSNKLIHILSPKKDDVLKVGEVFNIKWKNAILKTNKLSLKLEGRSKQGNIVYEKLIDDIAIDGRDTEGSYEWTVSYDWTSNDKSPVNAYRVKLCYSYACDLGVYSEFFQIEGDKNSTEYDVVSDESTKNLKTYSDDKLSFSFEYPDDLLMNTDIPYNKKGIVLYDERYAGNMEFGWEEVVSGFKIMIKQRKNDNDWWNVYGRDHYGEAETERFGDAIVKEIINIGDYEAAKRIEEGLGFSQDWKETNILETVVIPDAENIIEISLQTKKSDYDKYVGIFNKLIDSFKFLDEELENNNTYTFNFDSENSSCDVDEQTATYNVHENNELLTSITINHCGWDNAIEQPLVTDDAVYFSSMPDGLGGYIPYGKYINLYRLDLNDNSVDTIIGYHGIDTLTDIDFSSDNNLLVFKNNDNVFVKSLINNPNGVYPFIFENRSFGSFKFSPDNTKIAVAKDDGPDADSGAIYILNLTSRTFSLYAETEGIPKIDSWINNDQIEWHTGP